MGMFSLVLLSTSVGLTLGLIGAGLLTLAGLLPDGLFWPVALGCGALGFIAGTFVILRIRFR